MSPAALIVLRFIATRDGVSWEDCSHALKSCTPSRGGYHVRALTKLGFVERGPKGVIITDAGRAELAKQAAA